MSERSFYKTEQLILHVCKRLESHDNFGSTLLNKILYYSDNYNYVITGNPISELTYVRQKRGATPKPATFLSIRDSLIDEGKAELIEVDYFGKMQKRLVARSEPDLSVFDPKEIALIDGVIDNFRDVNAKTISKISHEELSWKVAEPMEDLPFYTYLLSAEEPTEEEVNWAKEQIKKY
jgi:hypothetical protein